jgi:uncharacterized protein with GYD domain
LGWCALPSRPPPPPPTGLWGIRSYVVCRRRATTVRARTNPVGAGLKPTLVTLGTWYGVTFVVAPHNTSLMRFAITSNVSLSGMFA